MNYKALSDMLLFANGELTEEYMGETYSGQEYGQNFSLLLDMKLIDSTRNVWNRETGAPFVRNRLTMLGCTVRGLMQHYAKEAVEEYKAERPVMYSNTSKYRVRTVGKSINDLEKEKGND